MFDELQSFSSFGYERFKTSNFHLIYNIGMGWPVGEYLTEIISLDEAYRNMFIFDKNTYLGLADNAEDFIIVFSEIYDESQNNISTDYYYINNKNPEKIFLFSSEGYNYDLRLSASENEFIMATNGFNYATGENENGHVLIFNIRENNVEIEKAEGLGIDADKIDENSFAYNMQGIISGIKIENNNVIITLTDIKMKTEDEIAFGSLPSEVNILIADYNNNGPYISVGDRIMVNCKYTVDKVLYTFGDGISIRN